MIRALRVGVSFAFLSCLVTACRNDADVVRDVSSSNYEVVKVPAIIVESQTQFVPSGQPNCYRKETMWFYVFVNDLDAMQSNVESKPIYGSRIDAYNAALVRVRDELSR